MFLFSNKLDLNQETCFTILVYSTGFQITLPALISSKVTRRDNSTRKLKPSLLKSYKEEILSNTQWLTKMFHLRLRLRHQVALVSTGKLRGKISLQFKETMTLRNWPIKFRPIQMSP